MCHPDAPATANSAPGVAGEESTIPVDDGESMPAYVARAEDGQKRGSVVVVGDIYGARTPFYEHLARLLADHGFDAIVPEFFFRVGPLEDSAQEAVFGRRGRLDERRVLLDLDAVISSARANTEGSDRVGTLGFCLGGTFVLDLAAMRDDLATVCYYGFPAGAPGAPSDPARAAPRPLDEVERMHGPIIGFWGDHDERVGIANVEELAQALNTRGVSFEHIVYPGLDHGFLQNGFDPGAAGHEHAAASWQRTLTFFDEHLQA